jgi:hypothetical protein
MAEGRNGGEADVFSAGTLVTAPGGHGTEFPVPIPTLENGGDAQAFVDARIAEGSHFIKVVMEDGYGDHHFNSLDRATVKAVIAAAHKRGKLAVVHISTLENARAALEAGADGLAHLFVAAKISQADADALAQLAQAKGAFVVPTFSVLESIAGVKPRDLLDDPQVAGLLDREERGALQTGYGPAPRPAILAAPKMVTAAMRRAGVPLLAGTDAGNAGTQYGASLHHELAALVDAGLSPREALVAATSAPAKAFRLGRRGQIAKGYKADLVLVEGNPLQDIAATRRIVEVWKDGESTAAIRDAQRQHVAQESAAKGAQPLALPQDGRISLLKDGKLASPFGTGWFPSTDKFAGGVSTVKLGRPGGAGGRREHRHRRPGETRLRLSLGRRGLHAGRAADAGRRPERGQGGPLPRARRRPPVHADDGLERHDDPAQRAFRNRRRVEGSDDPLQRLQRGRSGGGDHDRI